MNPFDLSFTEIRGFLEEKLELKQLSVKQCRDSVESFLWIVVFRRRAEWNLVEES